MTVSAALPDARTTAASDAHPDILSVVYDEQQIAGAVVGLGRWGRCRCSRFAVWRPQTLAGSEAIERTNGTFWCALL